MPTVRVLLPAAIRSEENDVHIRDVPTHGESRLAKVADCFLDG